MKKTSKELRQIQKELVDNVLTNPEKLENIINLQLANRRYFHQYTLRNFLLASWELSSRTGEGAELLAPYNKWADVNRHVKKGAKALHVLAPITKKIKDEETEEEKTLTWFKSVPVFDLSQTDGKPLETDFTSARIDYNLHEVTSRCNVPVNFSNKQLTRGYTDGEQIWISKHISETHQICVFFHELAHYHLHFDTNRNELTSATKELEAEAISFLLSSFIGIDNGESAAYIHSWSKSLDDRERRNLLKGKGSRVLKTAQLLIDQLKLWELRESKNTLQNSSKWEEINWVGVKE